MISALKLHKIDTPFINIGFFDLHSVARVYDQNLLPPFYSATSNYQELTTIMNVGIFSLSVPNDSTGEPLKSKIICYHHYRVHCTQILPRM